MPGAPADVHLSPHAVSRAGLDFAHRTAAAPVPPSADELVAALAAAFAADGAGLADLAGGPPLAHCSALAAPSCWPWDGDAALQATLRAARGALALPHPDGGSLLACAARGPGGADGVVWLEGRCRNWTDVESAAFALAAAAVARAAGDGLRGGRFERLVRRRQLEHTAAFVGRVVHDYGNVLTSILGFSELGLAQQVPPGSAAHRYLTEVHRGAESGAELTQQLRLFSRRGATAPRPCPVGPVLAEERVRAHETHGGRAAVELVLPPELPPAAIDADHLRVVVRALLDNAAEALSGPGAVTVTARPVMIVAGECLDYEGDVRPGPHVELTVADGGPGLSADIERRLFVEPFFSTKTRRRGFGLFAVYGILCAHWGGLRLSNGAGGGAVARVVLPAAAVPAAPVAPAAPDPGPARVRPGPPVERLLVVDDDPLVLKYVAGTLERAGYRVHAAAGGEEALRAHEAAAADPFRLLLSDVRMPDVSGLALAERLLDRSADVSVLFMSGQTSRAEVPPEIAGRPCEVLQKPFRPDGLLRAVRAALDRAPARHARPPREGPVGSSSR